MRGGALQLSSGIDESVVERIRALPGVRQVIGGMMDLVSFEKFDLFGVIVNGWPDNSPVLDRVQMVEGERFSASRPGVMLGKVLAANLGKHAGDHVEIYGQSMKVMGVFQSFNVFENGAVFMPMARMQTLIDRPHRVTGCIVLAERSGDARRLRPCAAGSSARYLDFRQADGRVRGATSPRFASRAPQPASPPPSPCSWDCWG